MSKSTPCSLIIRFVFFQARNKQPVIVSDEKATMTPVFKRDGLETLCHCLFFQITLQDSESESQSLALRMGITITARRKGAGFRWSEFDLQSIFPVRQL